jgi:endonuclease-3
MATVQAVKQPFNVERAFELLRYMTAPLPPAALFDLYQRGYTSLFEQLLACIISIRTYDETTVPVSERLFARARTPEAVAKLSVEELDALIKESSYSYSKAHQIIAIAQEIQANYKGQLPASFEVLTGFKGVGPKCAGLALGIAAKQPYLGVDVHVHRVTNRWGIVQEKTPEKTMVALQQVIPKDKWIELNALLVPFGKHICTGSYPKCGSCLLLPMCTQVGVKKSSNP